MKSAPSKSCIITQSNYIPWKGYFDSINRVDLFVVYDDMQYTKRDWRNRNLIKTPNGLKWLTIPVEVKGKFIQKIKDTKIADKNWNLSHWETIKQNYKSAPKFKEVSDWIEPLYRNCQFEYLTDVNLHFIQSICNYLQISTEIKFSDEFELAEDRTERLVKLCEELDVTDYFSGPAAKAYMEINKFTDKNINVHYWNYSNYPEYNQLHGDFDHGVSIIDLLLNEGASSINFLNRLV
jgi:hypothetical protein